MADVNASKYEAAAHLIATGRWRVDPEEGRLFGYSGAQLKSLSRSGYVVAMGKYPEGKPFKAFAHRVIWESVNGPIPDGMSVNHKNGLKHDNRIVNLELVSIGDNLRHAWGTGLMESNIGDRSPHALLSDRQALDIYRRCWNGERVADLAREFGVAYWTVSSLKHGRNWRHLTNHGAETHPPVSNPA